MGTLMLGVLRKVSQLYTGRFNGQIIDSNMLRAHMHSTIGWQGGRHQDCPAAQPGGREGSQLRLNPPHHPRATQLRFCLARPKAGPRTCWPGDYDGWPGSNALGFWAADELRPGGTILPYPIVRSRASRGLARCGYFRSQFLRQLGTRVWYLVFATRG